MGKLLLSILGLLVPLAILEIALRFYPELSNDIDILDGRPVVQHLSYLHPDKDVGYILKPNLQAKIRKRPLDGGGYYSMTIGVDGFRQSTERDSPIRTVFVGDSFTFGTEVDDNKTFPEIFGRLSGYNVKNFALPGANLALEAEIIKKYVLPWSPTHIVWCFFEENDLGQNHLFYEWRKTDSKNTFYYDNATRGIKKRMLKRDVQTFFGRHLMTTALFKSLYRYWNKTNVRPEYLTHIKTEVGKFDMALHEPLLDNSRSGYKPINAQEWKTIVREFENIVELTEEARIPLLVVLLPRREHIYMPLSNHPRGHRVTPQSHNGAMEHFSALIKGRISIPYLDLIEHFWHIAPHAGPLYNTIDGHFNEKGNEEVAKFLLEEGLIREYTLPK